MAETRSAIMGPVKSWPASKGERWDKHAYQAASGGKPRSAVSGTRVWPPGTRVAWNGRVGMFLRDADDDQVEVLIGNRTYRVRRAEVRSA